MARGIKSSITFRVELDKRPREVVELEDGVTAAVRAAERMGAVPALDTASSTVDALASRGGETQPMVDAIGPLLKNLETFVRAVDLLSEVR